MYWPAMLARGGAPAKVAQSGVAAVPVAVAGHHARRARPAERLQHQAVNLGHRALAAPAERDHRVSLVRVGDEDLAAIPAVVTAFAFRAPDLAQVADFVEPFPAADRPPVLRLGNGRCSCTHSFQQVRRPGRRHVRVCERLACLGSRDASRSAPRVTLTPRPPCSPAEPRDQWRVEPPARRPGPAGPPGWAPTGAFPCGLAAGPGAAAA